MKKKKKGSHKPYDLIPRLNIGKTKIIDEYNFIQEV
jgi:hypothetical protein